MKIKLRYDILNNQTNKYLLASVIKQSNYDFRVFFKVEYVLFVTVLVTGKILNVISSHHPGEDLYWYQRGLSAPG